MSDTYWIIAEISVGIGFLGVGSALVTVVVSRWLEKPRPAAEILAERYARGELTPEQYRQMRTDLGPELATADNSGPGESDDSASARGTVVVSRSR
jgi:hypothetical protein